jgi:oligopeptidase B
MTMGACLNMAPGLFGAAILDVPFLDPLTTMHDPHGLLTVKERSEWGDPVTDQASRDS